MTDLVERLRTEARFGWHLAANRQADTRQLHEEAAAALESTRARVETLKEALRSGLALKGGCGD